jgi:small subunit ribosomal protein S17
MKSKARNIGIDVKPPKNLCSDKNCPFHGYLSLHGNIIKGEVVSAKAQKTVVIERHYLHYLQKYERYEKRHSRVSAYNPDCIAAKEGDTVTAVECKPLSKTKHFVVVEKVSK